MGFFDNIYQNILDMFGTTAPPQEEPEPPVVQIDFSASDLNDVVATFTQPVLKEWLCFRKQAAEVFHKDWEEHPPQERIQILDNAAMYNAAMN